MIITSSTKKKKKEEQKQTPIKGTPTVKQREDDNNSWVKSTIDTQKIKNAWADGYQVGDISKTIIGAKNIVTGAAKDVATNIGKGFMSTVEGTVDAGRYLLGSATKKSAEIQADIWDLFGNESYANSLRKAGQDVYNFEKKNAQYDVTANLLGEQNDIFKTNWSKKVDSQSILGNKADSVSQGIGNVAAFVGLGSLTGGSTLGTFANSFASAYGNTRNEAYKNGADDKTANRAAWISGLSEAISEQFFSGIPGLASAGWGDALSGRVSKSVANFFGSKAGKIALTLFDGIGEGTEEILSNMFNAIGTDVMHYIDNNYTYDMEGKSGNVLKDTLNAAFSQDSLDSFVSAMLTSVLTSGGKQLTQGIATNQASNQVAKQGNITKTQANELINQIAEKRANLELDEDANFKEQTEAIDNQKKLLNKEIKQAAKEGQQIDLNELLNQTPNSRQEVQFALDQDEFKNIKSDKQKVLANDMARLNNVKENHELFKTVNAIQGANNTQQYHITTTEGLYEMGIVNKDANGNYTMPDGSPYVPRGLNYKDGDIYINADVGNQSGTQAMYHEMFEGFKKASPTEYNEFKQMVTDIIGEEAIQKEYDTYKSMYGEELTDDIRDEIINDKFGELAESQDFINRISDNRTLLQKFIDTIKDMVNYVKGTQQEKELIKLQRNLEKQFAKRYKATDFSGNKGETAYSMAKHYGDLGKGNDTYYTNMSGSRGTGHFGTGTYFVNEEYQPGETSSYANRPSQKVEFDDYNLFKPATETDGFTLHDGLKAINSKVIFEENMINEFESALKKYNDTLTEESLNDLMNLLEKNDYQVDDIQKLFDEGNSTQAEKRLIDRVEDIIDNYDTRIRDYSRMVDVLVNNTDLTRPQIQEAFVKARNKLSEYNKAGYKYGQYPTAKVDSLSTIFMKELGFNGIDVRGLDRLDNTTYGSVIYDLDNKKPTTNPDIRYSLSPKGEMVDSKGNKVTLEASETGTDKNLMAIHNLNSDKLNGVLDLGGIPYPSVAITKPSTIKHEGYGDISLLFNKNTIDPETNAKNKVYSRDAYTPRFPTIEYKISDEVKKQLRNTIGDYDYRNAKPGDNYISDARNIIDNLDDSINRSGLEKTLNDIKNNDAMKYVYLKTINPNFQVETKNEQFSNLYNNETLQRFLDNYDGKYELNDIPSSEIDNYTKLMVEAYKQQLQEKYDNQKIIDMQINNLENNFASKDNFLRSAYKLQKYGTEHQVLDSVATSEKINKSINQEEFNKWIDNQFKNVIEKKGLRNNKDFYTPSGTPRSFEQLHDEYTLENVVKIMDALNDTGEEGGFFYGISEIAGNASQRFNTIEDIRANENLLTTIGDEEYTQMLDNISNRLSAIEETIMERGHSNSDNYFIARDNLSSAIGDNARNYGDGKKIDANKVVKSLNEYGFNVTTKEAQQILDMFKEMRELPTTYFEAKPQRAVGLDEIQMAVIPNTASQELKQRLQDYGIKYTEYDPSIEGDRNRVVNQFSDLKFSMTSNENIDSKEIAPIGSTQQETTQTIQEELAPIRDDLSSITEQMSNLSNQIETLQNGLNTQPSGYVETYNEQRNENIPTRQLTEEDANTLQDALMQDEGYLRSLDEQANMNTENTKLIDRLTNNVTERLGLERGQRETLRGIIKESVENGYSTDEISDALQRQFSQMSYEMTNQEAVDARRLIRDIPINVSDTIKTDIADYGKWKQSNFGKINFSKNGSPVDVVYPELSTQMPDLFPSDITNPTDQLLRIAEVANMAKNTTETIDIEPEYFDSIADYIKNTTLEDEYNAQMQSDYDLGKNIQFNMNEDIAPTTIRTQESIDDYIENRDIAPINPNLSPRRTEQQVRNDNAKRTFREMFINRYAAIDDYSKTSGNRDIKFYADKLGNAQSEATFNINNKQTDINGNWIGKGLDEIFKPIEDAGLSNAFNDYLFNKSNIERHAVGKGSVVPVEVSRQLVKQYEIENPEFKEKAQEVYDFIDNYSREQVDSGILSQDKYDNFRGEFGIYGEYVPFKMEDFDRTRYYDDSGEAKSVSTFKRSKGGASDVSGLMSMKDAIANQVRASKNAVAFNELAKQIVQTNGTDNNVFDVDSRTDITSTNDSLYRTEDGDYLLSAYIDGEKVSTKISEELYNELARTNENRIRQLEEDFSSITNPLQKASNIRRKLLTTWNPVFLARNAIKDIQDAVINSKHTTDMLKNYFGVGNKSVFSELKKAQTKEAQQFLALYGADNLYGDYSTKGNWFTKANELIELAPRFAEFKASLQNGESVQEAIYNAREVTTNFGRGGYITKALNRNGFTFLNANVQGLDKLVRNISGENGVKGVTSVVVKGAAFAVLPSILNHLLYGLGDDKDEEYEALPDYIKDNYYLIKTDGNKFVRIPKGRINAVFGSLARRMMEAGEGEGFDVKEWADNAWSQIGVGDSGGLQTIFTPLQQAFGSKNGEAWYGGDIVPTRLQNKPAGEQYDEKTDAISKKLGELFNVSPKKINYVLDQYSGGIGDVLLPMITPATSSGAEKPHEFLLAPVKDAFVVNSTDDNKYAGDFYDAKDKAQIQSNSENATDEDKLRYKYMSSVSKQMSDLYKERREVQSDTTLSNKQKYAKVQAIQNEINNLAKEGLSKYNNFTNTDNYSSIGDTEYYKNAEGEWTKVSDDEQEFTAGLNDAEKTSYYRTKNKINDITQDYSAKTKGLTKDDPLKTQYSAERKENITQAITNSGLDNNTKAMIYSKYYSNKDTMTNAVNAGYNIDTYITALNDIEQIRNKYSQKNGYSTEERKQRTIAYINSLEMEIPQKAMMIRQYYTSFREYNNDIVNFVGNLNIPYEDKKAILEGTGMTVNGNNVSWK